MEWVSVHEISYLKLVAEIIWVLLDFLPCVYMCVCEKNVTIGCMFVNIWNNNCNSNSWNMLRVHLL